MSAPLTQIAITGASGHVGRYITEALLASNKAGTKSITALTRAGSTSTLPEGVKRVEVDYASKSSLTSALAGVQFLIITLAVTAPPATHSLIVQAAAEAKVPYVMPNIWGNDICNESLAAEDLYSAGSLKLCREIEALPGGHTAYVALLCGFWFEWSLMLGESFFGIDLRSRRATLIDDGLTKVCASTWRQTGRAVAGLLDLPEDRLKKWRNKGFYVNSFAVSQREILDAVQRVTGTSDEDWEIRYQDAGERYREGLQELQNGVRTGFAKAMYTRTFFKDGGGNFAATRGLDNEEIGLAEEDLDEAVKRAVELVESGWTP
ncbi:NAD(P)-binding protein [Cladorrhinum samala]|uniref:NAD(P)-binding protein n=1 Tax=Cladorrhinum samala TaxID=585594 RepID=A0AAV9HKN8_9PEZI|nr:NAD(P)-binding protein [Cladorrhinum samala]